MYKPVKFEDLDQEKCWCYIMGTAIEVGLSHLYCSPLRDDTHPGCNFKWYRDQLWLMDSAGTNETCVTLWMKLHNLSYWDAIKDLKFKTRNITYKTKPKLQKEIECDTLIDIKHYWRKEHEDYWNLRGIERPENVYGVISYTIEKECKKQTWYPDDLCFAYKYGDYKYKLYFPDRPKPRFISNLKKDEVWWCLRQSDSLLVSKAHKEFIEWKELVEWDITMLQSESITTVPFEWETYKQLYLALDSDARGLSTAKRIIEQVKVPVTLILIPNEKSVEKVEEYDLLKYLTPNVASYYKHHLGFPIPYPEILKGYEEGKDLDDLIIRNKNYKQLLEWILQ